ncbi:MAG: proline--tRNA ligase [Acholeplasmatales bacterium]|jgi:prolyl-tRNA synthetase|nr:proline--tRNA ligase [Acholeplasmatales bacterium]
MGNLVQEITSREVDFAKWYSDIVLKAKLMEYSETKGFIMYLPYGYAIWENIQNYLNGEFKKGGRQNVYFPLLIPESLFQKEKDHVAGFAPETAMVTTTGIEDLSERLIIRPTSEVLFCEYYKKAVGSYKDLPLKFNQWCSVVRWEKTTRPFLRGKEFLWQEGHTIHATAKEAHQETLDVLKIYQNLGKNLLAIPFVTGKKTTKEKFAGAEETYAIEALMPDGKALQSGTSHYFGSNFAKAFDIKYVDNAGNQVYAYQTSWGVSTRLLGAIIMVHGDDNGLVLPPGVAPIQIRIIPIGKDLEVERVARELQKKLQKKWRIDIDNSAKSPGYRFSEQEMLGIPLRIEIGSRDLANQQVTIAVRHNSQKMAVALGDLATTISQLMKQIHHDMWDKATSWVADHTYEATTQEEFEHYLNLGGYVKIKVAPDLAEAIIKQRYQATARVILREGLKGYLCPFSGAPASVEILFARAY